MRTLASVVTDNCVSHRRGWYPCNPLHNRHRQYQTIWIQEIGRPCLDPTKSEKGKWPRSCTYNHLQVDWISWAETGWYYKYLIYKLIYLTGFQILSLVWKYSFLLVCYLKTYSFIARHPPSAYHDDFISSLPSLLQQDRGEVSSHHDLGPVMKWKDVYCMSTCPRLV